MKRQVFFPTPRVAVVEVGEAMGSGWPRGLEKHGRLKTQASRCTPILSLAGKSSPRPLLKSLYNELIQG